MNYCIYFRIHIKLLISAPKLPTIVRHFNYSSTKHCNKENKLALTLDNHQLLIEQRVDFCNYDDDKTINIIIIIIKCIY